MRHATVSSLLLTGMLLMTVTIAVKRKVNGAESPKGTVIFHSRIRSAKRSSIPERNEFNAHKNDTNGSSKRDAVAANNWNILHENFRNEEDSKGNQEMPENGGYDPCICAINVFAIGGQTDFEGGIAGGNRCPIYCFPMPGMGIVPSRGIDGGGGFDGIMGIGPGVDIGAPQFQFEPMDQPQQIPIDQPYPVPVPYIMNRYIPISVPKPVPVPVPRPFAVHVQVPHPIMVPVEVPRPYPIGGPGIGIGPGGGIDRMPSMPMPVSDTCLPACDNPSDGFPMPIPKPSLTVCLPFCNNASNSGQMPMSMPMSMPMPMPIPAITICLPICENITESQNNSARRMQSSKEEDLERVQMVDTASGDAERVLKNIKVAGKHAKKKVKVGKKSRGGGGETEHFKNSGHGKDFQFVNHFRAVVGNSKRSLQDQKGLYDYDSKASIDNSQNYLEYVH